MPAMSNRPTPHRGNRHNRGIVALRGMGVGGVRNSPECEQAFLRRSCRPDCRWSGHRGCRVLDVRIEDVPRLAIVARHDERRLEPAHLRHLGACVEMLWSALRQRRVLDVERLGAEVLCAELSEWH